jgi:putative addiction module component (TIGR02574 family)
MQPILEQLKQLSFAEKLQLVEDLWDAIAEEAATQPLADWQQRELLDALAEYQASPDQGEEWEIVCARLMQDPMKLLVHTRAELQIQQAAS